MSKAKPEKPQRGRKPEVLKIEGDWKSAVSHAMKRGKPPATKKIAKKRGKKGNNDT